MPTQINQHAMVALRGEQFGCFTPDGPLCSQTMHKYQCLVPFAFSVYC
jgi:hypothetical protein